MTAVFNTQIIGAGPAGMSFFIALENAIVEGDFKQRQKLSAFYNNLVLIEASSQAAGKLGKYRINANTDAQDIVSSIADGTAFSPVRDAFLSRVQVGQPLISLADIDTWLQQPIAAKLQSILGDRLMLASPVASIHKENGKFYSYGASGKLLATSLNAVIACGASEPVIHTLLPFKNKTIVASDFLQLTTLDRLGDAVGDIVIVGASHSGFSCAWRLLNDPLFAPFIKGRNIKIVYRSAVVKLRGTREFAKNNAMFYRYPEDVCLDTELVYRHAGLRKDAKQLYLEIKNKYELRVKLCKIESLETETNLLESAALVIQCCGFSSCFPEFTHNGKRVEIAMQSAQGELHNAQTGAVIEGLFGNGLGVDIKPQHEYQGEASFTGSIHGLQIYQLSSSPRIIAQIMLSCH
jgi:hypothetical protein